MGYKVTYDQYIRLKHIEKQFGVLAALDLLKNGFEYGDWQVVVPNDNKTDIELKTMHWEFIPNWIKNWDEVKEARKKYTWLNAKSETLLSSKMFRDATLKRRCLIPLTHFFEWRDYKPLGEKKSKKYPYVIEFKKEDNLFIAGIWQSWIDKTTGELIDTFAIVTTVANTVMGKIHNIKKRQPTILNEDLAYKWIIEDINEDEITKIASFQLASKYMYPYTIAKDFRNSINPLEPFEYKELPELLFQ